MPTDPESGWVEPDVIINGRALTFAECMTLRVAVSSMRISLSAPTMHAGLGDHLATAYDQHLASIEQTMIGAPARVRRKG